MQTRKSLSLQIAALTALAMLFGPSAFAESRHHQGTSRGSGGRIDRGNSSRSSGSSDHQRGTSPRFESRDNSRRFESRDNTRRFESRDNTRRNESRDNTRRNESRDNTRRFESRSDNRRNDSRNSGRYRNDGGSWRADSHVAPYRGQNYNSYGRVDRFERNRNGYRVWIGGGLYPIFIPFAHWRLHPLRVGLFVRFGGYWDPLGFWSVYDYAPYYSNYGYGSQYDSRYDNTYTSGQIRGVVESVDLRRGTLVINDEISRQFVTVEMPRDRRMDDVRAGDYVEFSGDWTRNGVFNANRLDRLDEGRY